MKKILPVFIGISLFAISCSTEKMELFNGKNLDNWTIFVPDSVNGSDVFWVENGMLRVSGIPDGYIRTKEEFSSYELQVEWRWLSEPVNSGVLLHTTGEDRLWPNCLEAQLQAGNAGDFVLIGEGVGITVSDSAYLIDQEGPGYAVVAKMNESSENEAGEWNLYDIRVRGDKVELKVNGVLQNSGTAITKTGGSICIQSEGGPMEFRKITLLPG